MGTTPVIDGYYSDYTSCFAVTSGVIASVNSCTSGVTSYQYLVNASATNGFAAQPSACTGNTTYPIWTSASTISAITTGTTLYGDVNLTSVWVGQTEWYGIGTSYGATPLSGYQITNSGIVTSIGTCLLPLTSYSYIRDGSQNCAGFHIPYIVYKDAYNITQTIYLDECFDVCAQFDASSIVSQHYVTPCPGIAVSVQIGDQFCLAGNCQLNGNISSVVVYSSTGTALPGDFLYTTAALIIPYTTLKFIKKGTNIMDVNSGTGELSLDCSTSGSGAC
jgi:hypothetical protein